MITIKNTQRSVPLNREQIRTQVQKCLDILGYSDFDIGIWFTSPATIRKYNAQYRGKDKPTDILSFSYHPDIQAGTRITPQTPDDYNLGDLIICPAYIQTQLSTLDTTFDQRVTVLLVHGICHLLGYDHETDADYHVMQQLEHTLLQALARRTGT